MCCQCYHAVVSETCSSSAFPCCKVSEQKQHKLALVNVLENMLISAVIHKQLQLADWMESIHHPSGVGVGSIESYQFHQGFIESRIHARDAISQVNTQKGMKRAMWHLETTGFR